MIEMPDLTTNTYHNKYSLKNTYCGSIPYCLSVLSNPSFKQTLSYVGKYNGNVSSMSWGFSTSSTDPVYTYNYSYDDLDRLKTASYSVKNVNPVFIPGTTMVMPGTTPDYSEKVVSYDKQGNILRLQRSGRISKVNAGSFITFKYGLVDDLTFAYHGNQLVGAGDSGKDPLGVGSFNFVDGNAGVDTSEYTYDFNGNLTADFNKQINSIGYNLLNMPSRIFFSGHRAIGYFHDMDGVKRRSVYQTPLSESISGVLLDESVTDYCGNFIYKDGTLSMILTSDGYITLKGSVPTYHYYLRDYMDNNRVVIDQYGTVEQRNNYYAFGGVFESSPFGSTDGVQPYKHGGKELDRMHGLDWYDLGLRPYDGASGRFPSSMDPLCEKYYPVSPYAYCGNNPVSRIDPNGKEWITDKDKNITWNDNAISAKTTPEGYTYIGNDKSLLSHLGMSYNFPELSSNQIGFVAIDENVGMHMINVKEKSNARIEVNAGTNLDNATETNAVGKTFDGVNVVVTNVSSNSGTDGELAGSSSLMKVDYGGKSYTTALTEPRGSNYIQTGTTVTQGIVSIRASNISSGNSFSKIEVKGNWWVTKPEGRTPVVTHGLLPIPKSFTHTWTFPKR